MPVFFLQEDSAVTMIGGTGLLENYPSKIKPHQHGNENGVTATTPSITQIVVFCQNPIKRSIAIWAKEMRLRFTQEDPLFRRSKTYLYSPKSLDNARKGA